MDNGLNVYYQQANFTNSLKNEPCTTAFKRKLFFKCLFLPISMSWYFHDIINLHYLICYKGSLASNSMKDGEIMHN